MQEKVSQQQPGQKIKTASKKQVIDWFEQANKDLDSKKDLIRKSFKVCGISNSLDGKENTLIHCAKGLDQMKIAYGLEEHTNTDETEDDPFSSSDDSKTGTNSETNDSDSETDE